MHRFLPLLSLLPGLAFAQAADDYSAEIQAHRDSVHAAFLDPETSPMQPAEIAAFEGLAYYAPDPAYRVTARLERVGGDAVVKMNTSDGDVRDYRRFGTLHFELAGEPATLTAYQRIAPPDDPAYAAYLAVPFKDATSGTTTYAAGRYLDLWIPDRDVVVLDFNKAYAPYCAYSVRYSCILPPEENHLDLAVEAGVKTYAMGHPVVSEAGGYSAVFPGPPRAQEQQIDGTDLLLHMNVFERGDAGFMVMHSVVPLDFDTLDAATLTAFHDDAMTGAAQDLGGTVVNARDIDLRGVPGRAFDIVTAQEGITAHWRIFAQGSMVYQVAALGSEADLDPQEATRFLDSFRLLEGSGKPRLERLLDEAGYRYDRAANGDYELLFSTEGERMHLVVISTYAPDLTLVPSYEAWAVVYRDVAPLPDGMSEALMRLSGDLPSLSAQLFGGQEGEPHLVALSVVVDQGVGVESLKRIVESLATEADALEQRFLETDDF